MPSSKRCQLFHILGLGMLIWVGRIQSQTFILLDESAQKRVYVPDKSVVAAWISDVRWTTSGWTNGKGGVGYEKETGYGAWIATDVGAKMYGADKNTTCMIRISFNVDPGVFALANRLTMHVRYDDGFAAWLNGQKIASVNAPDDPVWNSAATQSHEASDQPDSIDVSSALGSLYPGINLLAIQALNDSGTSPDFLITASLSVTVGQPLASVETNLPIILIDTNGQAIPDGNRIRAVMDVIDNGQGQVNHLNDSPAAVSGPVSIEVRGQSSTGWPKKQYNVETQNADSTNRNVKLLGFPKENDWILYAPYIDKSLQRNVLAYCLSNRLGLYATRTRYCEMELNGLYQGVYVLMEKIKQDKNRVPIAALDLTDNAGDSLTGGYILKIDKPGNAFFVSKYLSAGQIPAAVAYQYHDPSDNKITDTQKRYIQDFMNRFEDVMAGKDWADPETGYAKWINVDTFADFFFVNEIARNVDGYRLSTYLYKDRDSRDGRLCMGPVWDFDLAFGNDNWYDGDIMEGWDLDRLQHIPEQAMIPFWWPKLFQDAAFRERIRERWISARQNELAIDSINAHIEAWADSLGPAVDRNFSIWAGPGVYGGNGGFWPVPDIFYGFQTYRDEIDYLKLWVKNRILWMDEHMDALPTTVDSQEVEPVQSFLLGQNYPNPFNLTTVIPISLKNAGPVRASVFNIRGERVWEIDRGLSPAGRSEIVWRGEDSQGRAQASGVYACVVHAGKDMKTIKMVLLK